MYIQWTVIVLPYGNWVFSYSGRLPVRLPADRLRRVRVDTYSRSLLREDEAVGLAAVELEVQTT